MKVTDLRRKLLAALAAGGLLAPSAMYAANLNTNLVVNGDFETVDTVNPPFGATTPPRILNWVGTGVAYSHDGSIFQRRGRAQLCQWGTPAKCRPLVFHT